MLCSQTPLSRSLTFSGVRHILGGLAGLVLIAILAPATTQAQDQTFNVNSTADAGDTNPGDGNCDTGGTVSGSPECTLRAAIEEANSDAARDKVDFSNIPTTNGFATISLNSRLEVLRELDIAGETAPGYPSSVADGPIVKLDGSNVPTISSVIEFTSDGGGTSSDSRVQGLAVANSSVNGIFARSSVTNVTIRDCFIGMDVDGETIQPHAITGILLQANNSTVFGNLVSGNENSGIIVRGNNNIVTNNIVGLDYDGDAAKGNAEVGIDVFGSDNQIGYAIVNPVTTGIIDNGNVVSANGQSGIRVRGDNNTVAANEIGTSADGSTATGTGGSSLGNGGSGIKVAGSGTGSDAAQNNLIGADNVAEARNLVSGNDGNGITLGDDQNDYAAADDTLRNNVVGLNQAQDAALPNGNGSSTSGGIVGGRVTGAVIDSNVVSGNAGQGIIIFSGSGNNEDVDIIDNLVGTNRTFAPSLGNAYDGIQVKPNPSNNTGEIQVVENIVGNNENDGIDIRGSHHDVADNFIGVAPDGSDIGNGETDQGHGIVLDNGGSSLSDVAVGNFNNPGNDLAAGFSTPSRAGNVIGYNRADGILVHGQASGIVLEANYIGTNPNGDDLGNGSGGNDGIRIVENGNSVSDVVLGYDESASISSPDPADGGQGNVVAFNSGDGISIGADESATGISNVTARGNVVYQNGAADNTNIGIDLGNSSLTANDAGDSDSGPNGLQNFSKILNVSTSNQQVTIDYEVKTNDTGSNYPLTVDFYAADSEQSGEGKIYLGTQSYSTANTTASVGFDLSTFSTVDTDDHFVATATDANGNTSEFLGTSKQLPVELASFEARQSGENRVQLTWTTASETGNAGFRVQHRRKTSGTDRNEGGWETADFVESKASGGTSTEATSYRFAAEDLGVGIHQFRLKQVDLDGTAHVHDALSVNVQMQQALRLSAPSPNPVQQQASLSFAVKEQTETTITLYNVLGQRVKTLYEGTPSAGDVQTLRLSSHKLSSGVYVVRMRAGGQSKTRRLTVIR